MFQVLFGMHFIAALSVWKFHQNYFLSILYPRQNIFLNKKSCGVSRTLKVWFTDISNTLYAFGRHCTAKYLFTFLLIIIIAIMEDWSLWREQALDELMMKLIERKTMRCVATRRQITWRSANCFHVKSSNVCQQTHTLFYSTVLTAWRYCKAYYSKSPHIVLC